MDKPPEGYKLRGLLTPEQALDLLNLPSWGPSPAGTMEIVFDLLYEKEEEDADE